MSPRVLLALTAAAPLMGVGCARQSEECRAFVDCAAHYADTFDIQNAPDTTAYDEDGSCWQDVRAAAICDIHCRDSILAYRSTLNEAGKPLGRCDAVVDDPATNGMGQDGTNGAMGASGDGGV